MGARVFLSDQDKDLSDGDEHALVGVVVDLDC